ncbi:MAG: hypothetical protein V1724_03845, partial [Chloroflexota bacterium]
AVYAAEKEHMGLVVLLLNLASVGTFLHTGLKLPYFTWFGPARSVRVGRVPWTMYAAMGMAAAINIGIGVWPAVLYGILPFPVTYKPYTVAHVSGVLQLALFTGLGFWLLVRMLKGEPTITLDTDWSYRRPARLAYAAAVAYPSRLFAAAERVTLQAVRALARVSQDPVGVLGHAASLLLDRRATRSGPRSPLPDASGYNPDHYRLPVEVMGLAVLALFVALMVWLLLRL